MLTDKDGLVIHALDPQDAPAIRRLTSAVRAYKALPWREARPQYDALLEGVAPHPEVTFEPGTVGGVAGIWVNPASRRADDALLHLHSGCSTREPRRPIATLSLDDARRCVECAQAAGVDARLDVWTGMPHGFVASVGMLKAAAQALDAIGAFLTDSFGGRT